MSNPLEQPLTGRVPTSANPAPSTWRGPSNDELANRFEHHPPPNDDVALLHGDTRRRFLALAVSLNDTLPAGREKALVFTALEEASMWAQAAIARNDWSKP